MAEPNRQSGENEERITEIEIERLRPFKEHPFQVKDVLYRVTPVFEGSNLVASGVLMEAESVEDKGEGILCCVYVYNVQPGININYATGDSSASGTNQTAVTEQATQAVTQAASQQTSTESYILNTNTKKFHRPSCSSVKQMKESNKKSSSESRDALIAAGYDPCKKCNP